MTAFHLNELLPEPIVHAGSGADYQDTEWNFAIIFAYLRKKVFTGPASSTC